MVTTIPSKSAANRVADVAPAALNYLCIPSSRSWEASSRPSSGHSPNTTKEPEVARKAFTRATCIGRMFPKIALLGFAALSALCRVVSTANNPIILFPGLAGSVLESKLNRSSTPSWYCDSQSDWKVIWLSLTAASRPDCLVSDLAVKYDEKSRRYANQTGVEIRPYKFGALAGVAALDPALPKYTGTFAPLIDALSEAGYVEGQDLFGAPYDFRLAADGLEQTGQLQAMKALIETAVEGNGGQGAVLVAHSMGNLVALHLLNDQHPGWIKAHIAGLVAINAPLLGAVTALKGSISGDNFDAPFIPHDLLRPLQSTAPSGPWLFPDADLWGDKVLVSTRGDNYTASTTLELLQDLKLHQQAAVLPKVTALTRPLHPLDFPVFCIYGHGVPTEESYFYDTPHFSDHAPDAPASVVHGDGDGTVNLPSLEACRRLGQYVQVQTYANATHLGILQQPDVIGYIVEAVRKPDTVLHRLHRLSQGLWRGLQFW